MPYSRPNSSGAAAPSPRQGKLPRWLVATGSAVIFFHLFAVVVQALSAFSGPWPYPMGANMATPPQFAFSITELVLPWYLKPLKMTHDYHFPTNRTGMPGVWFEVKLRDDGDQEIKTVRIPEEDACFWTRHRQTLLALALVPDEPVQPRQGETIAAPGQQTRVTDYWDMGEGGKVQLRSVPEHLVPRDRPVLRPSDWSRLVVRSYGRYLCRKYGAASAELIRHSREAIMPAVLFMDETPADAFNEVVCSYGELKR
jgi:hypothetical protein